MDKDLFISTWKDQIQDLYALVEGVESQALANRMIAVMKELLLILDAAVKLEFPEKENGKHN